VLPAGTCAGLSAVMAGTPGTTARASVAEVPPPGGGFSTHMFTAPVWIKSAAGTMTVSCVSVWPVMLNGEPSANTMLSGMKPDPCSVTARSALPATTAAGSSAVSTGMG